MRDRNAGYNPEQEQRSGPVPDNIPRSSSAFYPAFQFHILPITSIWSCFTKFAHGDGHSHDHFLPRLWPRFTKITKMNIGWENV